MRFDLAPHQVLLVRHAILAMHASIKLCLHNTNMPPATEHACEFTCEQLEEVIAIFSEKPE
jgi:hypothetical protein